MSPKPAEKDRFEVVTEVTPEDCTIDRFSVRSPGMKREIKAAVVLPPGYRDQPEKRYPILYTFHGHSAPHDTFAAMVPLRRALRDRPMIVTCFDGDAASLYLDSPYPQKWSRDPGDPSLAPSLFTTFFLEEFIPCLDRMYRVDAARRMLTGFSMGGYGAFHYLLARPGQFASVSSLSGWFPSWDAPPSEWTREWMETLAGPREGNESRYAELDFFERIKKQVAGGGSFPPLLLCCGTEDSLLEGNRAMRKFLDEQRVGCEYVEGLGDHKWAYWQGASAGVIDFHWRTLGSAPIRLPLEIP